ncbi:hypothetical protein RI367_008669 [Sorochytrium milnesiophthora]
MSLTPVPETSRHDAVSSGTTVAFSASNVSSHPTPFRRLRSSIASYTSSVPQSPSTVRLGESKALSAGVAQIQHICAYVVCIVFVGQAAGWNSGMDDGWPSMCAAAVVATVFFWLLGLSIAEMACSLPFAGGPTTFSQAAFGHELSAFIGLVLILAYCVGLAQSLVGLAINLSVVFNFPPPPNNMQPVLWILLLEVLLISNHKSRHFFNLSVVLAVLCCLLVVIYTLFSFGHMSKVQSSLYVSQNPVTFLSFLDAFTSAIFLYCGLEAIPFAAEECKDITVTAPKAMYITMSVLTAITVVCIGINCGLMPDINTLINSTQPFFDSIFYQLGIDLQSPVAVYTSSALMIIPNFAGVHALLYASSRIIYSLARAGYFPRSLSLTVDGSPVNANWASAYVAFGCAIFLFVVLDNTGLDVESILTDVSVWFFAVSYLCEMVVYIRLRQKLPTLPRPWKSPAGLPGAVIAALISAMHVFGMLAVNPGTFGWCFFGLFLAACIFMVYFHLFAKSRLRNSPDKEFIKYAPAHAQNHSSTTH